MLIDVHSHFFRCPEHFQKDFIAQTRRVTNPAFDLNVRWEDYRAQAKECDWTVVFGGKAALAGLWVPDAEVAAYAKSHADKAIGFLSLDPSQAGWQDELHHGHQDLKLKGIKLMPMYAGFYPNDRKFDYLWEYASSHQLPVLLHTGTTFIDRAPLDCTLPRLIDDVAIRFPRAKIIMAHLSHPYEGECVANMPMFMGIVRHSTTDRFSFITLLCWFRSIVPGARSSLAATTPSPPSMPVSRASAI